MTDERGRPRAVILAAGRGRRLAGGEAGENPKILLDFGGRTLLERHLRLLRQVGISSVTIVVGYESERVRTVLTAIRDAENVVLVMNPNFAEGSVVSLHAARGVLEGGAPVLLMDGDVLYDERLLRRLTESARPNCLLLDREIEPGDEPVKLCVDAAGRIVDFRKRPTVAHEWHGESVGFFRFAPATAAALAGRVAEYVARGDRRVEYEEPIRDMILADGDAFGFEDITGLPWTEIDFPEDVVKASDLLPRLVA